MIRTIQTKEELNQLKTGRTNRCVKPLEDNGYWSENSVSLSKRRRNTVSKYIDNGWIAPSALWCYENELLEGNTRVNDLKERVNKGIIDYDNFPSVKKLVLRDISKEINPDTGKCYTYEEAEKWINGLNIHTQTKHKIDDFIDTECNKGNKIALTIRRISDTYDIPTSLVCDDVLDISGASRNNYVDDIIVNGNENNIVEYCEDFASFMDDAYWESKEIMPNVSFKNKPVFPAVHDIYKSFREISVEACEWFKYIFLKMSKMKEFHESISQIKNNSECKQKILQFLMNYKGKSKQDKTYHYQLLSALTSEQKNNINSFIAEPNVKKSRFNF